MYYFLLTDEKKHVIKVQPEKVLLDEQLKMKTKRDHKRAVQNVSFLLDHNHPGLTLDPDAPSAEVNLIAHLYKTITNHCLFYLFQDECNTRQQFPEPPPAAIEVNHRLQIAISYYTYSTCILQERGSTDGDTVNDHQQKDTQVKCFTCAVYCDTLSVNLIYLQTLLRTQRLAQIPTEEKVSGTDVVIGL